MNAVVISGTGLLTPDQSISNEDLVTALNAYVEKFNTDHAAEISAGTQEALAPSTADFIEKASGIKSRYVMDRSGVLDVDRMRPNLPLRQATDMSIQAEMAAKAVEAALKDAGRTAADVDGVLVACSNMQRAYPAIAIEVQSVIGAEGWAYDLNVACSSATFGIQAAVDAIRAGNADVMVVVNPEITSAHNNFMHRDSHFIFGDACTAVVLERAETCQKPSGPVFKVLGTKLKTHFSNNIRNDFGFIVPTEIPERDPLECLFRQNGRQVFKEVCPMVADMITDHLAHHNLSTDQVRRMWLHQANLNMNQLIAKRVLGRAATDDEAPVILDTYANTSSAGSIIAFHQYHQDLAAGDIGVICSFGAGYSIGSVIVECAE